MTSAQIKDGTIQSRDVRNGSLTGTDVKDRSLTGADLQAGSVPRSRLGRTCSTGYVSAFGGCVRSEPYGRSSLQSAVEECNSLGGRLPTTGELRWIAGHDEFAWADGNQDNYEFSGSYTSASPFTPLASARDGSVITNASAQLFWWHCVVS